MADAVTALIGAIIMIGYLFLIAAKLAAPPLWICVLVGIVLMVCGFWIDDWKPIFQRDKK
jgi:UDP-N-acetylmuramyl pentapeptide phosphotransferase/UDP-N-acetylglucosamine-1-phosphate transferase